MNHYSGIALRQRLTILICRINHPYIFQLIQNRNVVLSLLNGIKLLVLTITPFATAVLSKHIQTDWERSAMNLYAFNFVLMGIAMSVIWGFSYFKGFAKADSSLILKTATRFYMFAGVFSTSIRLISYISRIASLILFGIMFVIFISPENYVNWLAGRI